MTSRRLEIVRIATTLFAERGFHGVSVDELGAACGMSGPALYKHFSSKDEILGLALTSISQELLDTGRARSFEAPDHDSALDALIAWHLEFAIGNPAYIVVQDRDWASMPTAAQQEVRRLQLAYIDLWVRAVRTLRPRWDRKVARAAVQATFGLLNSTPRSARISEPALRRLLAAMARRALLG